MAKKIQQYFEGVGRRKTSICRVRLTQDKDRAGLMINNKPGKDYLNTPELMSVATAPLKAAGVEKDLRVDVHANGGGQNGQAQAIQMGVSRALVKFNSELHRVLRDLDYLKRDPRKKERKKPGLKKARRAPQWAKR
jgi:small subunit ribosomal protein S9